MSLFRKSGKISNQLELVSLHIPKTAGTSFRNILKDVYGASHVARLDIRRNTELNGKRLNSSKLKSGIDLHEGTFGEVIGGSGGHCASCNRLRLTSDGLVKPCLFSDEAFSIREMGAREALLAAVENKPKCGSSSQKSDFYNIGG